MSSGFNVIRRHSLDATGVRIKELTQALATARSKLEANQLETDDIRSQGRMDHSTIKLNDERLSFGTTLYALDTDYTFEFPQEPDLKYLKCWYMLDHLGAHIRDISGFGNDAYVSGHPTLRRAPLDLGFQQLPYAPGTPVMLFNSGTDVVSQIDGEYIWIPDNETIQFSKYQNGFSIHFRFCCLNFEAHYPPEGGYYARRFASKTDDANNGWSVLVYSTGTNTGGLEVEIKHNGIDYAKKTYGYNAGMWYQIVVTYNPNAGVTQAERIKIYTGGNENSIDSTFGTILSTTYNLRIGARSSSTGFFHGYIHDFRMWFDKVLTQDEVNNINRNELTIEPIEKGHVFVVQYALVQGVLKSKYHVWDVVGRILKVRSHRYNILIKVPTISKTHKWNIRIRVSLFKIHEYNIVELVQRLLTIIYDQAGGLVVSKTHKWNMAGKITRTHTHVWNVTSAIVTGLLTQYKRFAKSTTAGSNITQDVTFTGKPQALIVWSEGTTADNTFSDGYQFYYGFSDGTNHGCISSYDADNVTTTDSFSGHKSDKVIAVMNTTLGSVASEATVSFIDTNTARFNWTTNDNRAVYVHCLAIWGITAAEVKTFDYGRITTGNQTYTLNNASLLPRFIHTITRSATTSWSTSISNASAIGAGISSTKRWSVANTCEDARSTSAEVYARGYYSESSVVAAIDDDTGAVEALANVSSFANGNFVLNWTDAPPASTSVFSALVLDTGTTDIVIDVGSFSEPASTGTQNISVDSGVNQVRGLMVFTNGQATSGITTDSIMSVGAGTGTGATEQGCVSVGDDDVSGATITARINKTGSIIKTIFPAATASSSTTNNEASLSTLGIDQFTLNWSARSGTRRCHYIVFGGATTYQISTSKTHIYDITGRVDPPASKTHKYNITSAVAPTITDRSPAPDATDVAIDANIVITFSEAIDANYVGGTWFILAKTSDGIQVGASEILSPSNVVTISPSSNLSPSTNYTVTVKGSPNGVRDLDGNQLVADVSWTFTTAAPSYTEIYNQMDGTTQIFLFTGSSYTRAGILITSTSSGLYNQIPKRVTVHLQRQGTPGGTIYVNIRKGSDNSVAGSFGTILANDVATSVTEYTFTNDDQSYTLQSGDRIVVEYNSGNDETNGISPWRTSSSVDPYTQTTRWTGSSWTNTSTSDFNAIVYRHT